jgi:hypothetical protein
MTNLYRKPPFAFAEIMVTAPWVYTLIAKDRDNDRGEMLQCNIPGDERSPDIAAIDRLALEREARIARAVYVRAQVTRALQALRELMRGRAGRPQPQQ